MRFLMTLTGAFLVGSVLHAQKLAEAAPPAVVDPANNRLDALLVRWEQEMKTVQTLAAQCNRTMVDKTFGKTEVCDGSFKYMKPNLVMMEIRKQGKAEIFEKFVSTGTYFYQYLPANKVIRVQELPQTKDGQPADESFLGFLRGMKAEEAKGRYDLKLVKEDDWYVYIEVLPKYPLDKADFSRARLVLNNKTFLPRELWLEQPNGNEIKWDLPKMQPGAAVVRTEFLAPTVPQGWNMEKVPLGKDVTPQPRVVRDQNP